MQLVIPQKDLEVAILAESPCVPRSDTGSVDNASAWSAEFYSGEDGGWKPTCHRVVVRQGGRVVASQLLLAGAWAAGVHERSAFVHAETCFVAVGPFISALELPMLRLLWRIRADSAACFGIFDAAPYDSIISHGELEIARLSYTGQLLWSAGGADIFSEGFELHEDHAEAIDFFRRRYRFDLESGESRFV